jgi:hypothetical protein
MSQARVGALARHGDHGILHPCRHDPAARNLNVQRDIERLFPTDAAKNDRSPSAMMSQRAAQACCLASLPRDEPVRSLMSITDERGSAVSAARPVIQPTPAVPS